MYIYYLFVVKKFNNKIGIRGERIYGYDWGYVKLYILGWFFFNF